MPNRQRGFSLIEVLVVIAVISILAALSFWALFDTNRMQALEKDLVMVQSVLERARSLTLASSGDRPYGVHFEESQVVLFPGTLYNPSDEENIQEPLHSLVTIASTSLSGGGTDVVFERLTGEALEFGTIELSLRADSSQRSIIIIHATGLVE